MSKAKSKAKQMKGKLKETAGRVMHDKSMEGEGRGEQLADKAQQATTRASRRMKRPGS
ncbi:CsbD family protein [Streptomyces beigongshangae]|uniref:CsbD family protein n=1 Tax=Streptomyces beigongshangae TaxID=2841597 RepID=UPI001C85B73B|nr:CsbD family protein [Streptomyces sp. REN17]